MSPRRNNTHGRVYRQKNLGLYAKYLAAVEEASIVVEKAEHRLEYALLHPRLDPAEQTALLGKKERNLTIARQLLAEKADLLRFYDGRVTETELELRRRALSRAGINLGLIYEPPDKPLDKHLRQRTGNDDHLELGIHRNPRQRKTPAGPVEIRKAE